MSNIYSAYRARSEHLQALPPKVQEAKEKAAIQNDRRLVELLGDEAIVEIRKVEGGYLVVTASSELRVDVHYLPPEGHICGPAKFELFFHQKVPSK